MELTTAQKNELATRLVNAQQTGNYQGFNDLVRQLRLTQADLLQNFPAINQAGINEQIDRGAVVPTSRPAATTYSTAQVANAIRDSLNAGFTVQQARMGAMTNFGLSSEEFDRALSEVQVGRNTFSDERVAQAIRDSLAQGFTMDQARQGALANYGVGADQFNRAMQMVQARPETFRGSAPTFQFPGLLSGREDMPTGARRFLSQAPGSLLFDVPQVEGGEFTFTPGEFDLERLQAEVDANRGMTPESTEGLDIPTTTPSATKPATQPRPVTPVTPGTTGGTAPRQYTDTQVAQALRESMAQGFSLEQSIQGAMSRYGVPRAQLDRAVGIINAPQTETRRTIQAAQPAQQEASRAPINTAGMTQEQYGQFLDQLREARNAAGLPEDPTQWTASDRVIAAEIQNELEGLGQFGRVVVDPETGAATRTPVQAFSTLPQEQQQQVANYLSAVVPVLADRSIASGTGWNDLTMLSRQYRVTPDELLGFMSPEQQAQFQDRFSYQLPNNLRLFNPQMTGITGESAEFNVPQAGYLQQAAGLLGTASPEVRENLAQLIYSGATMGDLGAVPLTSAQEALFGTPWWRNPPTTADAVAALASGNPTEYYRQQAIARAQAPLSETFSDAATRTMFGGLGVYDVTASLDRTPYIEGVNLFGDRAVSRLREMYGLSDEEIGGLLDLIPQEVFMRETAPGRREPIYPGELSTFMRQWQGRNLPPAPSVEAAVREGLLAPAAAETIAPAVQAPVVQPPVVTQPVAPAVPAPVNPVVPTTNVAQANLLAPTTRFSDAQVAQAIMDSLGQGFDMGQIQIGALNNFGVDQDQFTRAAGLLPSMGYNIGQGFTRV